LTPRSLEAFGTHLHVLDAETGVIPAALAGLLLGAKAPGAHVVASVTFVTILVTILIQAPTTERVGRRLGLLEE
jgi:potassium/hydrogen antiporter